MGGFVVACSVASGLLCGCVWILWFDLGRWWLLYLLIVLILLRCEFGGLRFFAMIWL